MDKTGKNKFYRTLNLDDNTKKLLRAYKKLKTQMDKEPERKN